MIEPIKESKEDTYMDQRITYLSNIIINVEENESANLTLVRYDEIAECTP